MSTRTAGYHVGDREVRLAVGDRVIHGPTGRECEITAIHGRHAEVDAWPDQPVPLTDLCPPKDYGRED